MSKQKQLAHEVSVFSPYITGTHVPRCTCGWQADPLQSELAARVAAKEHRLATVVEDDANKPVKRGPGRPRKHPLPEEEQGT